MNPGKNKKDGCIPNLPFLRLFVRKAIMEPDDSLRKAWLKNGQTDREPVGGDSE
jgi:hypothetical protein